MSSHLDTAPWLSTALMFALVGAGVLQTSPRNSGRPPATESIVHSPLYSQQISARLWEDPLQTASRAQSKMAGEDDKENVRKWSAASKVFIEQTKLDYQTRKLTILALSRLIGSTPQGTALNAGFSSPHHARQVRKSKPSPPKPKQSQAQAERQAQEREAAKREVAQLALAELWNQNVDTLGPQKARLWQLIKIALRMQGDVPRDPRATGSQFVIQNEATSPRAGSPLQRISQSSSEVDPGDRRSHTPTGDPWPLRIATPFNQLDENQRSLIREKLEDLKGAASGSDLHASPELETSLEKILSIPARKTLLLPIVVPEQMYPEVREQRLRMRYAVVAALTAANFNPESADELSLVPVPVCTSFAKDSGKVLAGPQSLDETERSWVLVPYEIFRRKEGAEPGSLKASSPASQSDYWQVVVFWIDSRITKNPALYRANIDCILNALCPPELRHVRYISAQGSEMLTDILASEDALGDNRDDIFYFPFATVPREWLKDRVKERLANPALPPEKEPIVRMQPVKRVQASDDYVIEMLLDELSLRLPSFGKRKHEEICLFYETDSFYGRSMVDVFRRRYRNFTDRPDANILSIPYLKGVDGTLPTAEEPSPARLDLQDTTALLTAINKRLMQSKSGQWVLDQRQTDYIERQADALKSLPNKIRAIGVFGTNVFDKIKLIEILRREFKDVWFFTVDLDASLINNNNPLVTRNLLIGSALDLSVQVGEMRSPPFRDSFQSAAFLSTLDALGLLGPDYAGKPGVWETARIGFQPMAFSGHPRWKVDSMSNETACGNGPEKGQAWSWDTFLETHFQVSDGRQWSKFLKPFLLILTTAFLIVVAKVIIEAWRSPTKPGWHRDAVDQFENALPSGSYLRVLAGMFAAVSALCFFGWLAQRVLGGLSEPFHWFDGVSVWPSLLIRGFATALGFYFFMRSFIDTDEAIDKMWTSNQEGILSKGLEAARFPRTKIESRYYSTLLILVVSYVLIHWALIQMFGLRGGYFTPARGSVSFFVHEITLLFSMAVFYLLVWSAVLRHLRCRELLCKLMETPGASGKHPPDEPAPLPEGALSKREIDALLNYNQAVVRSVLYPFAMLVVFLASRHPIFDAWNFPKALLISSTLILGVLVFCAYLLNESANRFAEQQRGLLMAATARGSAEESATWQKKELSGSFLPFWKQPVIQALTLAAAGVGLQWIQ